MKINLEVDSDHCPADCVPCGTASQGPLCVPITRYASCVLSHSESCEELRSILNVFLYAVLRDLRMSIALLESSQTSPICSGKGNVKKKNSVGGRRNDTDKGKAKYLEKILSQC